jgi:hypothetical protein
MSFTRWCPLCGVSGKRCFVQVLQSDGKHLLTLTMNNLTEQARKWRKTNKESTLLSLYMFSVDFNAECRIESPSGNSEGL